MQGIQTDSVLIRDPHFLLNGGKNWQIWIEYNSVYLGSKHTAHLVLANDIIKLCAVFAKKLDIKFLQ